MSLKVSIHQPAYLPWLGYLSRIAQSDVFVFLDTVQFEKNSFINRNRIKTPNGPIWLTVPVLQQGHLSKKLNTIEIDARQDWKRKHLKSIELSYRKAPQFSKCFPEIEQLFLSSDSLLADLCFAQLLFWLEKFSIKTRIIRASSLSVAGHKSDLILALCHHLNASEYLSGPLGRDYLNEESFKKADIRLSYQSFVHPTYPQLYGEFSTGMAALDCWMNCVEPKLLIKENQSDDFLT
jgi:hypothetical protein